MIAIFLATVYRVCRESRPAADLGESECLPRFPIYKVIIVIILLVGHSFAEDQIVLIWLKSRKCKMYVFAVVIECPKHCCPLDLESTRVKLRRIHSLSG